MDVPDIDSVPPKHDSLINYCAIHDCDFSDIRVLISNKTPNNVYQEAIGLLEWYKKHPIYPNWMIGPEYFATSTLLRKEIALMRKAALLQGTERPLPYSHESLLDIDIGNDNLVSINLFDWKHGAPMRNGYVFQILPCTPSFNSMYWTLRMLNDLSAQGLDIRIRLDPFQILPVNEYVGRMYFMMIYGRTLDWERIDNLREQDFVELVPVPPKEESAKTQLVWDPRGNEIHFQCEELTDTPANLYMGSRYLHAIHKDKNVIHSDGALRFYNEEEHEERLGAHIRNTSKPGKRLKVFQVSGVLDRKTWCDITCAYFVWNDDVQEYFNRSSNLTP